VRLRFTPRAARDLEEIAEYIRDEAEEAVILTIRHPSRRREYRDL
jgi:plasmid stabilization system protein ParE